MPEKTPNRPFLLVLRFAVLVPVVAAIITATYFSVDSRGRLPEMPRVALSRQDERLAIDGLKNRVAQFTPTPDEQGLIQQLEELNLTESGNEPDAPPPRNLEHLINAMKKSLGGFADSDEHRFFLLGDMLALRFHHSLHNLFKSRTSPKRIAARRFNQVRRHGGAFYSRSLDRGVITPEGNLSVFAITPEVLFRYRWRHLGGRALTRGFSEIEKKALYDFIVRFGSKEDVARRLDAANQLKKLDKGFDAVIAEALIHHQSGNSEAALETLEDAAKAGRRDKTISGFIRFLRQ